MDIYALSELIGELQATRESLATLADIERKCIAGVIAEIGHKKIGSETYEVDGIGKITIKTGENFTLDKAALNTVWTEDMPINREYAYTLRKRDFDAVMSLGDKNMQKLLSRIVTSKPAKPSVTIDLKKD